MREGRGDVTELRHEDRAVAPRVECGGFVGGREEFGGHLVCDEDL